MSEPKPDIMDGCGVSFWIIASLVLLLAVPVGIRTCSDSGEKAEVDELERMQRIRKIEETNAEERTLRQQLTITLDEAMTRALSKHGGGSPDESSAADTKISDADENATRKEQP